MYCGKSKIPLYAKVEIIYDEDTGAGCSFLNMTGTAQHPFYFGCRKHDWIGILLDEETYYGKKINIHSSHVKILDNAELPELCQ